MESINGLEDIRTNIEVGNPEARILFNRERVAAMGLDVQSIATVIREKIQGEVATEFAAGDRKVDVRVRVREEDRRSLEEEVCSFHFLKTVASEEKGDE